MLSAAVATLSLAGNPSLKLNNGVMMPQLAAGTWQYSNATAKDSIAKAVAAGFTHIDTAENYGNQIGVGQELAALFAAGTVKRSDLFITTKTLPCDSGKLTHAECMAQTLSDVAGDLADLGLDYVDLILLHGPSSAITKTSTCNAEACEADAGSWAALEQVYAAKKVRAIGVSNYCQSCFECLLGKGTVTPAVNQFALHVGMGDDPGGLVSYTTKANILVQAYSPLGDGALPTAPDLAAIGKTYNKAAAQVALKWLADKGIAVTTKADNAQYLVEDLDLYSWNMTAADTAALSANRKYPSSFGPSWACKS